MKSKNSTLVKISMVVILPLILNFKAHAQLSPLGTSYFQNEFLLNPALAGVKDDLELASSYRKQWSGLPGSPTIQVLTANYAVNDRLGVGVNIYNDKAGVLKRTRVASGFSYHFQVGYDLKLSFGTMIAVSSQRLSNSEIVGESDDPDIINFNEDGVNLDGDFGASLTNPYLTVQLAFPNLRNAIKKANLPVSADYPNIYSSIAYKLELSVGTGPNLEPKIAYRHIAKYKSIIDVGSNITYDDVPVSVFAIYHSSKSVTAGIGVNYKEGSLNLIYTSPTSVLKGITNPSFEVSLKVNIHKDGSFLY